MRDFELQLLLEKVVRCVSKEKITYAFWDLLKEKVVLLVLLDICQSWVKPSQGFVKKKIFGNKFATSFTRTVLKLYMVSTFKLEQVSSDFLFLFLFQTALLLICSSTNSKQGPKKLQQEVRKANQGLLQHCRWKGYASNNIRYSCTKSPQRSIFILRITMSSCRIILNIFF